MPKLPYAIHLPGYNYCGPGTWDFMAKPKNDLDRACREHDFSYDRKYVTKTGKEVSPYFHYTPSDERLRTQSLATNTIAGNFINQVFLAKKYFTTSASPKIPFIYKNKMKPSPSGTRYRRKRKTFQFW